MNPNHPNRLADKLKANPSFFRDMDEALLGDIVFQYHEGELTGTDAAEVEALLRTDPRAKLIQQRLEAADRFISSKEGSTRLDSLLDRVLPPKRINNAAGTGAWHHASFACLGMAAQSSAPSPKTFIVEGKSLILLLIPQADGENLTVEVYTDAYQPSSELDGAVLWIGECSFRIEGDRAVVPLAGELLTFRLTTADGDDIPLNEQS